MAKKTYTNGYIFTTGTSGSTQVTLPDKASPEQILLIIHVPSKTTLYNFNDTTFNAVTFTNIQRSLSVQGNVQNGNTAIKFTTGQFNSLNYNTTGVQQGWRIAGNGMPTNGATVDYTNGTDIIYLDVPATATETNTALTFSDRNYQTRIGNIPIDTSAYATTDKLLIITDSEPAPLISFRDFLVDPVGKLRVSQPQSLIDTDFEYGPQPTKWQTMKFINNYFASYGRNTDAALAQTANISAITGNGTAYVSVTTSAAHGLTEDQPITVVGTTDEQANGEFLVSNINATTFRYVGTGTVSSGSIFQNGVAIYPGAFFTGANIAFTALKTFGNTTVEVITQTNHGLKINNTISVVNFSWANVRGPQTIATVGNGRAFTYETTSIGGTTTFTGTQGNIYVRPQGIAFAAPFDGGITMTTNDTQPNSRIIRQSRKYFRYQSGKGVQVSFAVAFNNPAQASSNIQNRAGVYDDQNGAFWEWDGTTLWAVRRSSVRQLTGSITVTNGSANFAGSGTLFTSELSEGEFIVVKGNSYKVIRIISNTSVDVAPTYRADSSVTTLSGVRVSKTTDARIPQSGFNIDKADGTGITGFNLDINKILMYYIDYAWYGAGTIRFGVKDQEGEITYLHSFVHGNNKVEAYFRSGNLPVRYEVLNGESAPASAPTLFHWGTSMIMDGLFNEDRGYTFSATGQLNTINQFSPYTILNIRLAPTADNGIPGGFGVRDLCNHMQLWPLSVDISATDACQIQIILNGTLGSPPPTWVNVGGNSLAQYDDAAILTTGGEIVWQGIVGAPAPRQNAVNYSGLVTTGGFNFQTITYDLSKIKELNNSLLGGFNTFPDGPDTLSVVVTPLNNNVRVQARAVLRWQENQA
jgi:hypothetical protein